MSAERMNDLGYATFTAIPKDWYTSFVTAATQRRDECPSPDPMDVEFANTLFISLGLFISVAFLATLRVVFPRCSSITIAIFVTFQNSDLLSFTLSSLKQFYSSICFSFKSLLYFLYGALLLYKGNYRRFANRSTLEAAELTLKSGCSDMDLDNMPCDWALTV